MNMNRDELCNVLIFYINNRVLVGNTKQIIKGIDTARNLR